ncbi:hypothetical protein LCGC14_0497000 [marine sediment metagenome]|uniref:Uncharacterized protein n=1 Tax=marine sediment metagenome TaxID=412755 RepID=A0A0F9SNH6_9ZZZZ
MKKIYIFPLVGVIVILFGLCFPAFSLYSDINIWLWGFYTIENKDLAYFRNKYVGEFESSFNSIRASFGLFAWILLFLISIIRSLVRLKKSQVSVKNGDLQHCTRPILFFGCLILYTLLIKDIPKVSYQSGIFLQFLGGFFCLIPSLPRLKKHNYKINKYLTLKLKGDETVIYIVNEPFEICKYLILNIPVGQVKDIESIDEIVDGYGENIENEFYGHEVELDPKESFKGHCSNLQVWVENNYETCLLDRNLAFPLLKRLTEVGDLEASSVFKDEIRKRFKSLYSPVQQYLICEGYLKYFSSSEKQELMKYVLSVDSWVSIAEYYNSKFLEEEAIEAYEHALKIDPINKLILKRLCNHSVIIGDYPGALKYYKSLAEFYGLENHDYLSLGDIYIKLYQYNNAKRMYRRVLWGKELNCKSQALLNLGSLYISEQAIDRAKRMYWDVIELNPSEIEAWISLSDLFQREGKISNAIETLKEGLGHKPFNAGLLIQLQLLYKSNKNYWDYTKTSFTYHMHKIRNKIEATLKKIYTYLKVLRNDIIQHYSEYKEN